MNETIDRWRNRRRMAWVALFALIGFGVACLILKIAETQLSLLINIVWICGSVVGAYVGFATFDDKWQNGK